MSGAKKKLSDYNDRCVRIVMDDGVVFEGACQWLPHEYNDHEFGVDIEGLQLSNWIVYADQIVRIEEIGPDNPFSGPYGTMETENLADGPDSVEEELSSEETVNVFRMLRCLSERLEPAVLHSPAWAGVVKQLRALVRYDDDDAVREAASRLLQSQ